MRKGRGAHGADLRQADGFALVSTVLLLALLAGVIIPLGMIARLQRKAASYDAYRLPARAMAWSALQWVLAELPAENDYFAYPYVGAGDEDGPGVAVEDGWWLSSDAAGLFAASAGGFLVRITDEGGKVPLSWLRQDILAALPGMNDSLAAAVLDWVDDDDEPREGGAEIDYYKEFGYRPRNSMPPTVGELVLAAGIDEELLWGEDRNRNGLLEAGEDTDGDRLCTAGIAEWITVVDAPVPGDLIDVNTAAAEELVAAGRGGITMSQARAIVARRENSGNFTALAELADVPELGWDSLRYLIDRLRPLGGNLSGRRVNLNTAPAAVLAVLPGSSTEFAAELLERRQEAPLTSLAELWELTSFTQAGGAGALLDWVDVKGGVLRLQVTAWPGPGRPVVHAEAYVAVAAGGGATLLYWAGD